MRKLLWGLIVLILLFIPATSATVDIDVEAYIYFNGPELPTTGNCEGEVFTDVTPTDGASSVIITAKGVQFCVNITPPSGCNITVTYQWLNYTEFLSDWGDWVHIQPWGDWYDWDDWYDDIDWDSEPSCYNDTYWYDFTTAQTLDNQTEICIWNDNVSCYIENDWTTRYFDWRVNYSINCSGDFTNGSCYYYFVAEECPVIQYIYPPSPNGTVCPCCDSMCISVNNTDGNLMNLTFYRNDSMSSSYYIVNEFAYVSNGTYCFCIDGRVDNSIYYPINFNQTYHWYVNITDTVTDDVVTSDEFQFWTMPNPSYCPCGPDDLTELIEDTDKVKDDTWIIGLIAVFSLFGILAFIKAGRR